MRPPRASGIALSARAIVAAIAIAGIAVTACAGRHRAPGTPQRPGWTERGDASWYGPRFHGRITASGERYNMMDLTAAHRSLPFGTWVRVTNRRNGRSLVVRINDRGPFVRGRIVDLSYAGAKVLGMSTAGVVDVTLRVIDAAEGERIARIQRKMITEGGVRSWSDRDHRALEAAIARRAR